MDCNLVDKNAEDILYAAILAKEHASQADTLSVICYLHCRLFQINEKSDPETLKSILTACQNIENITLYACADGDLIFQWRDNGNYDDDRKIIKNAVLDIYKTKIAAVMSSEDFFTEYTHFDNISDLKSQCLIKQGKRTKSAKELANYMKNDQLIHTFAKTMNMLVMQRAMRVNPQILIVEDQTFSQKMLLSILKGYTCHVASNIGDGLLKYIEKCPDIVLLDIDLPDISGHALAELINKIDRYAFIVMVTANYYESDVKAAKTNNVQGFIPKPYKKQAILDIIEKYKKHKEKSLKKGLQTNG